ncbi:MAG: ribonuclease III [Treponema sp.]|nr:ribonuclease III [Treponema sp.]
MPTTILKKPGKSSGNGQRPVQQPDSGRKKVLNAFQKAAGIRFRNLVLLNCSFMHRSVSNESGHRENNERLEFLGDAVLGAVTAALLYKELTGKPEGELAKIKSVVVSENILAGVARELQIDGLLLLGKGEELSGGRQKSAILADAMEALIGALYLDSGYKAVFAFVSRWMGPEIDRVLDNRHHQDYKSLLQEFTQRMYRNYPVYHLIKRSGPDHNRLFWIEVRINDKTFGPGMGKNKKSAEQEAARMAYEHLAKDELEAGKAGERYAPEEGQ